ncbi:PQQ-dependent sugar dehydrogenase [Niveispirillum sp. KHB5.9]|uniref:PQQ-dependent sugar dehydrogenase n=1 Tax=Niveispirillum sp. KHB5.9 TaxID=3400269 RepID=UPI003A8A3309
MSLMKNTLAALAVTLLTGTTAVAAPQEFTTFPAPKARHDVKVTVVADGLDTPWAIAFMPDGRILVTERTGKVRVVKDGKLLPDAIAGLPKIEEERQGGLLDIALDPDYAQNKYVYLSFMEKAVKGPDAKPRDQDKGNRTVIARFTDDGTSFKDMKVLFKGALVDSGLHFGSRFAFDKEGHIYFGIGERGQQDRAQDVLDAAGKVFRLNRDGSVPTDNPFAGRTDALPEVFTYGNRNPQGLATQPSTGLIWESEHGPQGGDEINIIRSGTNYGWPVITYGKTYGLGLKIGEGTEKAGMAQPELYFVPSLALAGMTFYEGGALPFWRGDLIVGLLAGGIARLDVEGDKVVATERLLTDELPRTRDVAVGPDGRLYALIEAPGTDGKLVRIDRK